MIVADDSAFLIPNGHLSQKSEKKKKGKMKPRGFSDTERGCCIGGLVVGVGSGQGAGVYYRGVTACQEGPGVSQWTPPAGGEGSVRCYVKTD